MEDNQETNSKLSSAIKWLRENLFYNIWSSLVTILCIYGIIQILIPSYQWLFVDSLVHGDAEGCKKVDGACLAFLKEKMRYILLGMYPREEHVHHIV